MRSRWTLLAAGTALLISRAAHSCYSGLVIVPTADLIGQGQVSIDLQSDGPMAH